MATLLGRPAIPVGRISDMRQVQAAIDAARQRLDALDAAVNSMGGVATATPTVASNSSFLTNQAIQQVAALDAALVALTARVSAMEAAGAGQTIAVGTVAPSSPRLGDLWLDTN